MPDRGHYDVNLNPSLIAVSNADGVTPVSLWADPSTHGLIISASLSISGADGAITDGVSSSIKATVFDLTNSNPLAAQLVDASGTAITSFGGGVQYTEGDTDATITGTALMWEDAANTLVPVNSTKRLPVDIGSATVTVNASDIQIGAVELKNGTDDTRLDVQTIGSTHVIPVSIVDGAGAQITSFGGGTQYTEDAVAAADPVGTMNIAVRADALAAVTTTDGDNIALRSTNKGELYVKQTDAVPVTDNGGSLTVDGSVTANAGTNLNTSALALESGGNLATIAALSKSEDAAHASGDKGVMSLGVRNDAAATLSGADGDYTPMATSAEGYVRTAPGFMEFASLSAGSLNADLVAATDVSGYRWASLQIGGTFTGTLSYQGSNDNTTWFSVTLASVTASSGSPGGTATAAALVEGPINYRYFRVRMTAYTSGTATGVLELFTTTSQLHTTGIGGSVTTTSQVPGTGATNLGKAEDAAHTTGDTGVMALAVRQSTATDLSAGATDGDYEPLQVNSSGRLWASATIDAALPAGSNAIGKLAANSGVIIGAVEIAASQTLSTVTTVGTVSAITGGATAHDAAAAAINPLLVGGFASAAAPTDVSADNDSVRAWYLRNGAQATALTAAGALIGGDAANGLDVDVTRMSALVAGTARVGQVQLTGGATSAALSLGSTVTAYGNLRVTAEPTSLFNDPLDGSTIDTTNRWNAPATVSGMTVTQSVGNLTVTTNTTNSASAYIDSVPTFAPLGISFSVFGSAVKFEAQSASFFALNQHRFWGLGSRPATFDTTTPLKDAIGFEIGTDGQLYCVVYENGTNRFRSSTSLTGVNLNTLITPSTGFVRFGIAARADTLIFYIGTTEYPAQSFTVSSAGFALPDVQALPIRFAAVNAPSGTVGASTFQVSTIGMGDTGGNNTTMSDGTYPWRKATVSSVGAIKTDGSAVTQPVSISSFPSTPQPVNLTTLAGNDVATSAAGVQLTTLAGPTGDALDSINNSLAVAITKTAPVADDTSQLFNGGQAVQPQFATIATSASGATTLVPAQPGKRIRVLSYVLTSNGTVNVKFQSHTVPTDITGLDYLIANTGVSAGYSPVGHFQSNIGEALDINLSGAIAVGGHLTYIMV